MIDPAYISLSSPLEGQALAQKLQTKLETLNTLEDRISVLDQTIKGQKNFSTSMGMEDQAIIHAIAATQCHIDVFFLDTGRHFADTLETLDRTVNRYKINIDVVVPDSNEMVDLLTKDGILGFRSSIDKRKACCTVRKITPLKRALSGASVWITGLRQSQSFARSQTSLAEWDDDLRLIKVNAIFDWSDDRLYDYLNAHSIPINPLHAAGFPSIGCSTCTRAISRDEHPRAGRWWWERDDHRECGLHNSKPDTFLAQVQNQ